MTGIIKIRQLPVLSVNSQGVLGQVIGADAEKIRFLRQPVADHYSRRRLYHDTLPGNPESSPLLCQLPLRLLHDFLNLLHLFQGDNHGIHNGQISV